MSDKALLQFDSALTVLLKKLTPAQRKQLSRLIARDLRNNQLKRIRRQQNPDGSPYAPRKASFVTVLRALRFLWRGQHRQLKNWRSQKTGRGEVITGIDVDNNQERSFYRRDIERFIAVKKERISTQRKRKQTRMFKKLASAKYLRRNANDSEAVLFFSPQVAEIAETHHFGLTEKGRYHPIHYPARQLLGLTPADIAHLEDQILAFLAG
ncbi:phage virion morphogenesis protein [Arsenophonus nasoniae]|uniref:Phage virion morphogenesis protein n=1 Tax=Arsenophonus nasoniae TaxID=638 RepID=A0AA95K0B7_9GAMM|nr:phage virion morphogenesis protein [Arsenophonus nasoniae]WGL95309.1 phage virion morphogenesis protein [Arsenophonus nasoniae]